MNTIVTDSLTKSLILENFNNINDVNNFKESSYDLFDIINDANFKEYLKIIDDEKLVASIILSGKRAITLIFNSIILDFFKNDKTLTIEDYKEIEKRLNKGYEEAKKINNRQSSRNLKKLGDNGIETYESYFKTDVILNSIFED